MIYRYHNTCAATRDRHRSIVLLEAWRQFACHGHSVNDCHRYKHLVNHMGWRIVVVPIDRRKSVNYRCVIERFYSVLMWFRLALFVVKGCLSYDCLRTLLIYRTAWWNLVGVKYELHITSVFFSAWSSKERILNGNNRPKRGRSSKISGRTATILMSGSRTGKIDQRGALLQRTPSDRTDLTQSYDKNPFVRKSKKQHGNTKTPPKTSLTQRLRTE